MRPSPHTFPPGPANAVDPSLSLETASRDLLDQIDQRPALSRLAVGVIDPADYRDTLGRLARAEVILEALVRRALPPGDPIARQLDGGRRLAADLKSLGADPVAEGDPPPDRFRPGPDFALGIVWALWFRHRRDPSLARRLRDGWPAAPTDYLTVREADIDRFWTLQKRLSTADPAETAAGGRHGLATMLEIIGG